VIASHAPYQTSRVSPRKGGQSLGEYKSSSNDVIWGGVFIRTVAVSVAAGDEQHRNRSDARDEKRVVIRATDHGKNVYRVLAARLRKGFDNRGCAVRRRVGIQQLTLDRNFSPNGNRRAGGVNCIHNLVAPLKIRVAYVNAEADSAWNAIDRAGKHVADAHRCHCVDRSAGTRSVLNRQNRFARRAESALAVGHQNPASVST